MDTVVKRTFDLDVVMMRIQQLEMELQLMERSNHCDRDRFILGHVKLVSAKQEALLKRFDAFETKLEYLLSSAIERDLQLKKIAKQTEHLTQNPIPVLPSRQHNDRASTAVSFIGTRVDPDDLTGGL